MSTKWCRAIIGRDELNRVRTFMEDDDALSAYTMHVLRSFRDEDRCPIKTYAGGAERGLVVHELKAVDDDEILISDYGDVATAKRVRMMAGRGRKWDAEQAKAAKVLKWEDLTESEREFVQSGGTIWSPATGEFAVMQRAKQHHKDKPDDK